jgi:hypothetical protein
VTWPDLTYAKDPNYKTPYARFFRFSFGPLLPETFDSDIQIMTEVLEEYKTDAAKVASSL